MVFTFVCVRKMGKMNGKPFVPMFKEGRKSEKQTRKFSVLLKFRARRKMLIKYVNMLVE